MPNKAKVYKTRTQEDLQGSLKKPNAFNVNLACWSIKFLDDFFIAQRRIKGKLCYKFKPKHSLLSPFNVCFYPNNVFSEFF